MQRHFGQFPLEAGQQAKAFLQACASGTAEHHDAVRQTTLLELSAVADALQAALPAADSEPAEQDDLWQAQACPVDVLARARERQLCGVLLDDPRYRLRHLKSRLETQHDLLQLCARHAAQHPDHGSALLVQQLVVPRTVQGSPNPLHASLEKLDGQGRPSIAARPCWNGRWSGSTWTVPRTC